jgi:hypothetical protein
MCWMQMNCSTHRNVRSETRNGARSGEGNGNMRKKLTWGHRRPKTHSSQVCCAELDVGIISESAEQRATLLAFICSTHPLSLYGNGRGGPACRLHWRIRVHHAA